MLIESAAIKKAPEAAGLENPELQAGSPHVLNEVGMIVDQHQLVDAACTERPAQAHEESLGATEASDHELKNTHGC
jgi:hypothetical protein